MRYRSLVLRSGSLRWRTRARNMPLETIASQLPAPVSSVRRTRFPSGFSTHCE